METTIPLLDQKIIQEKTNEFALKGALKAIEDFYTGYNSPYIKAIEESLKNKGIATNFELPDIIATINESLSNEVDKIANTAIAQTFVPLVQRFLTREEAEIKFSEILTEFIKAQDEKDEDDFSVEISKSTHGWLNVNLKYQKREYKLTLHEDYKSKKESINKYIVLSLPYDYIASKPTMKLSLDKTILEMPFTKDVLADEFMSYIARIIISSSKITMDCDDFSEDMFRKEECHC